MKVFLVDDSSIVLEKLAAMISGIDGVEIAGQALNANDAIQSIVKLKPDVAILDIRLNGGGIGILASSQRLGFLVDVIQRMPLIPYTVEG